MALQNGNVVIQPSYEKRLGDQIKAITMNGKNDNRTTYALLLFYIWSKTDEQRFCDSDLNHWVDELGEFVPIEDSDPEVCGGFFKHLEKKRNQDIDNILMNLNIELHTMIKACNEWLELHCFEEMEPYKYHIFRPLYVYIDLLKITRAGIAAFLSDLWHMHPEHKDILQSINYQSDLDFSKIDV